MGIAGSRARRSTSAERRPPRRGKRDWRPGGDHVDPRAQFKVTRDEKRARFKERHRRRDDERPAGDSRRQVERPQRQSARVDEATRQSAVQRIGRRSDRPRGDRPFQATGRRGDARGDRPFGNRPPGGSAAAAIAAVQQSAARRPAAETAPFKPIGRRAGETAATGRGDRPSATDRAATGRGDRPRGDRPSRRSAR